VRHQCDFYGFIIHRFNRLDLYGGGSGSRFIRLGLLSSADTQAARNIANGEGRPNSFAMTYARPIADTREVHETCVILISTEFIARQLSWHK
jgi:hypothetical protein